MNTRARSGDRVEARADAALIKALMRRTAEDVITIGLALIRQKKSLGHGPFGKWIELEFGMNRMTSSRFMNVAEQYGAKSNSVLHLDVSALYELAAPSTTPEVQAEVERRIAAGDLVKRLRARASASRMIRAS